MAIETHECAADGCTKPCSMIHFMCIRHWRMVAKPLRDDLWDAWLKFHGRRRAGHRVTQERKRLVLIRELAIAAVRGKEMQRAGARARGQSTLSL